MLSASGGAAMPTLIQDSRQCCKEELRASQHMNLLSFFLESGRETIFSAHTTDVDPHISFFSSVWGEFAIICFTIRHRDTHIWHAYYTFSYSDQD